MKPIYYIALSTLILTGCAQKKESFSLDCDFERQITIEGEEPYSLKLQQKRDFVENKYGINAYECPVWSEEKIECSNYTKDDSFKLTFNRRTGEYTEISRHLFNGKLRTYNDVGTCKPIGIRTKAEMMQAPASAPTALAPPNGSASMKLMQNFRSLDYDSYNVSNTEIMLRGGSLTREQNENLDKWKQDKLAFANASIGKKIEDLSCESKAQHDTDSTLGCYPVNGVLLLIEITPEDMKKIGKMVYKGDEFLVSGTISSLEFFSDHPKNYLKKINGDLYDSYAYQPSVMYIKNGSAQMIRK